MTPKYIAISIVAAALMLSSLCAAVTNPVTASTQVGAPIAGTGPGVCFNEYNYQAYVFATDTSGVVWFTTALRSGNGTWQSIGGSSTSAPAAVSWSANYLRLDVFVRGSDGALWWKYYQNGWSDWQSLGGKLAGATGPAVASWSPGRLDVFVTGTDDALYHKWYTGGTWSSWENLGGKLTSSPAATFSSGASPGNNYRLYAFVRGSDGALWQKYWQNGWSSWKSLGGQIAHATGPAVTQYLGPVLVQGTDHQLWETYGGGGSPWRTLTRDIWNGSKWTEETVKPSETLSVSAPAVILLPDLNPMAFVSSTSGNVWWSWTDALGWTQWNSVGSPP